LTGNSEVCEFANPTAPSTYYLMIKARSAYTGVHLLVTYTLGGDSNEAPLAAFTAIPRAGTGTVDFDASASNDSDGTIVTWDWSFGDGGVDTGENPSHTYASSGTYTIGLTVTDEVGATDSTWSDVVVSIGGSQTIIALEQFGLSRDTGGLRRSVAIPAGATNLRFEISGGTGEADLYAKEGAKPTNTDYDCRPRLTGNSEVCEFANPTAPSTYYLMIKARTPYAGVHLLVTYTLGGGSS
jgi:PKD repeat protein